ncbi:titin homolog isoform X2 [Toxorhynchites rutilus septentrionalis]|nr:titin homolog isoform X2 [Toxorhynchites rutilus septentrionalis]
MDEQGSDPKQVPVRDHAPSDEDDGDTWIMVKDTNSEEEIELPETTLPERVEKGNQPDAVRAEGRSENLNSEMELQAAEQAQGGSKSNQPDMVTSVENKIEPQEATPPTGAKKEGKRRKKVESDCTEIPYDKGGNRFDEDVPARTEDVKENDSEVEEDGEKESISGECDVDTCAFGKQPCMQWYNSQHLAQNLDEAEEESEDDDKHALIQEEHIEQALVPDEDASQERQPLYAGVTFSIILTAIIAILVGNMRVLHNRMTENDVQHTQQILELSIENEMLRAELNNYLRVYSRGDLEDQVNQANLNFKETLAKIEEDAQAELEAHPDLDPSKSPPVRIVQPEEDFVPRKVVWSGDEEEPMLIIDKEFVLPHFCRDKTALKDGMYNEYASKYCDISRRKIDAKLHRAKYLSKHKKYKDPIDYKKYIYPTEDEIAEEQKRASTTPPKAPHLKYQFGKAFQTIKEEASVVLESLAAILDLDPKPEKSLCEQQGYSADDEGSSTCSEAGINWVDYPPWVRGKYENQPEIHNKLKRKASMLWNWEKVKNRLLGELGVDNLEDVQSIPEEELQQRKQAHYKMKKHPREITPEEMGSGYKESHDRYRKPEHPNYDRKNHPKHHGENGKNKKHIKSNGLFSSDGEAYSKQRQDGGKRSDEDERKHHQKEWTEKDSSDEHEYKQKNFKKDYSNHERPSGEDSDKYWEDDKMKKDDYKDWKGKDHESDRGETTFRNHEERDRKSSDERHQTKPYPNGDHKKHYKQSKENYSDNNRRNSDNDDDDDDDNDEHYKHRHPDKRGHDRKRSDQHKHHQRWSENRENHHHHEDERWNKRHEEDKWRNHGRRHSGERQR